MTIDTYKIGSASYCDIANDEGGKVCDEFANDSVTANELYDKFCGKSADNVEWPENATEKQIRTASRLDWETKLASHVRRNK